jgi:hypothetical protein
MSDTRKIVCKPTRWFTFRAAVMLLMFGVFAVLFYYDGSTGYRKKNEAFYLHKSFEQAGVDFSDLLKKGDFSPELWRAYAAKKTVKLPEDRSVLPPAMPVPHPWPEILHDFQKMKDTQWNLLWREYTRSRGMDEETAEQPYDARKIREQWVVFWISLALALAAGFYLIRTLCRSISADDEAITDQRGRRVPYPDLRVLDLRKWETKGLAFIEYDGPSGKGRLRIDGLTYGGFKAGDDQPAEQLMQRIKERFSGEIIEFTTAPGPEEPAESGNSGDNPA